MKVSTRSEQPHLRAGNNTPYTQVTVKSSSGGKTAKEKDERQEELVFLWLLVQALNPRVGLKRVNAALARVIDEAPQLDFEGSERR